MTSTLIPSTPLQQFDYGDTEIYRDYRCVNKMNLIDSDNDPQEDRKREVLQFPNNKLSSTKRQTYAKIAQGKMFRRMTYASNKDSGVSHPNVQQLIRVDENDNVINEKNEEIIPDTKSSIPLRDEYDDYKPIISGTTILKTQTRHDQTTIYFPLVTNKTIPSDKEIVKGGILYSGTYFDPTIDRELQRPDTYKIRERTIISNELAELFNVDVVNTYTDEEIFAAQNKSVAEMYPEISSWDRENVVKSYIFNPLTDFTKELPTYTEVDMGITEIVTRANITTEILPVAYAYVDYHNYDSTNANDRRGVNIYWNQWNTSTRTHTFTFDTPMEDANYSVITDRNYETFGAIHIFGKTTTGFTAEWENNATPGVFGGTLIVYASTPTKPIGGSHSTQILPVAYAYVNSQNYGDNFHTANDRRGVNISWNQWDSSTSKHYFTFDTPMQDNKYSVITDTEYESSNCLYITSKSTVGFYAYWHNSPPPVFSGTLIVYASTPTKIVGVSPSIEILPVAYAYVNAQNYGSSLSLGENNRRGVNISWNLWNAGTLKHIFTFDRPMENNSYNVVTDRNYESAGGMHISGKTTTGFTAEWENNAPPHVFGGTLVVYASTPTKTIGGTKQETIVIEPGKIQDPDLPYISSAYTAGDYDYNVTTQEWEGTVIRYNEFINSDNLDELTGPNNNGNTYNFGGTTTTAPPAHMP